MHKITLTGVKVGQLKKIQDKVYSFDMKESGSPNAPKGLPKSTEIHYTVFATEKHLKKLGLLEHWQPDQKLVIQGEPTLDIPIQQCPGEVAVIAFQLQKIETKVSNEPQ